MNSRRDINKEIDNCVKGNYSKKNTIELLKREGFSDSEINEHIHKLDAVEKTNSMNYMFVPGFIFLVIASIATCILGFSSEENGYNTISFIAFLISLPLIYFYYKGDKFSILFTGFAIICFIGFMITNLFHSFTNIFSTIFVLIFSISILISVKNYYKSIA